MIQEIFKKIIGFENYEISNLGNVKSNKFNKERILKPRKNSNGYLYVNLSKNKKYKSIMVHKLVSISFLNNIPDGTQKIVTDHIDNNKLNNKLENLQLISQRENTIKSSRNKTGYFGVYEIKGKYKTKYCSKIIINKKFNFLGYFDTKIEAHNEYLKHYNKFKI